MPDHEDSLGDPAAGGDHAAETEDLGHAAERLERALERIATAAQSACAMPKGLAEPAGRGAVPHEVMARLDAVIAELRSALGSA